MADQNRTEVCRHQNVPARREGVLCLESLTVLCIQYASRERQLNTDYDCNWSQRAPHTCCVRNQVSPADASHGAAVHSAVKEPRRAMDAESNAIHTGNASSSERPTRIDRADAHRRELAFLCPENIDDVVVSELPR
jgi:hypothetical protein